MASPTSVSLPPWPPAAGLTTINCPLDKTVFTINASTHIDAPAFLVWNTLRNTTAFPDWNSFTPHALITSQPFEVNLPPAEQSFLELDTAFTYTIVMDPLKLAPDGKAETTNSQEKVSDVSTPNRPSAYVPESVITNSGSFYPDLSKVYRIAWITDGPIVQQGLFTERFSEIIDLGEGNGCEYRTWESQGGKLAVGVKQAYETLLQARFEDWCRDLKFESEKIYSALSGGVTVQSANEADGRPPGSNAVGVGPSRKKRRFIGKLV